MDNLDQALCNIAVWARACISEAHSLRQRVEWIDERVSEIRQIINDNPAAFAVPLAEIYKLCEADHTPKACGCEVAKD